MSTKSFNNLERLRNLLAKIFKKSSHTPRDLMHDIELLSNQYTGERQKREIRNIALPYALYFMPEHLPKILFLLAELNERFPETIKKARIIYDLGCGTGTGTLAFKIIFGDEIPAVIADKNPDMLRMASEILSGMQFLNFSPLRTDYLKELKLPDIPAIYITMNSLSENAADYKKISALIQKILTKPVGSTLILIEPLTNRGKEISSNLRNEFGSLCIMPCTSQGECPMVKREKRICNFSIPNRISESLQPVISARHRTAIFSYLVLSNLSQVCEENIFRLISNPLKRNFGFEISVCNQKSLYRINVRTGDGPSRKRIGSLSSHDLIRIHITLESYASPIGSEQIEILFKNRPDIKSPALSSGHTADTEELF